MSTAATAPSFSPTHRVYHQGKHHKVKLLKWEERDSWRNEKGHEPERCSYSGHNDVVVRMEDGRALVVGLIMLEPFANQE